jgi:outer membrane protein OmpA-like peptidoglycan-associated protein
MAGVAKYNGCPVPDTDADGMNDDEDKCVNEAGTKENGGCPEIKKEVIEKVNYSARQINFELRSDVLTLSSIKVLDEIIIILKAETGLKISVEGHSSLDGTSQANLLLSQKRADRVKQYMISKGINQDDIAAIGYGISKPLSAERTEAANKMNRRVEIKLDR